MEFRFKVGDTVCLRGSGVLGVVRERFVNYDTNCLLYGINNEFNQSVVLMPEGLVISLEDQLKVKDHADRITLELTDALYERRQEERQKNRA